MGSDRIAIIRGRAGSGYDWFTYRRGQVALLDQGTMDSAAEPLPDGLDAKRVGATTIALPASQVFTRIMTLPLLDPEELAGAVALQVDKFSPFPVEQIVFSYEILQQTDAETSVLIAISQQTSVEAWGTVPRQAGMQLSRVDCAALGAWQALRKQGALDTTRRQSLLLLDQDEVVLLTHDAGRLLSISGLGPPGNFSDSDACADLAEEVARILMEAEADHGVVEASELALLSYETSVALDTLQEALAEAVEMQVVQMAGQPFPDIAGGLLQRSLAVPNAVSTPLNLIPPEWVRDADTRRFRNRMIVIGSGLLGLWMLLLAGGLGYFAWERVRLEQLREREEDWRRPANVIRSMRLQANLIDRYHDRTYSALEVLREISALQPGGVDLVSFTYRRADGLEIIGEADSGAQVLQFNERLNDSALFRDVRPGTRTRTQQGRHRFSFDITFGEVEE